MRRIQHKALQKFLRQMLRKSGANKFSAETVATGLCDTSLRGVESHGVRLFPHYIQVLKAGRINGHPQFAFNTSDSAVATMEADHAFGHAAGVYAMQAAIERAKIFGISAVSVRNSSHFGAAACFGLLPPAEDQIGIALTHATPLMLSTHGKRSFFGANPICFCAPMEQESPMCHDMSTTQITFNSVKLAKERGKKLPPDLAYDRFGQATDDPLLAEFLAASGDYKGFGLSIMVDVLCALLSGMPAGDAVSQMYGNNPAERRRLGQFFIAIDIGRFTDATIFKARLQALAAKTRLEPAQNPENPVLFPGDPEKSAAAERSANGIPVEDYLWQELEKIAAETGISLDEK